ncbi:MAG: lipoxygenase [Deltaproteobacteria bacterium]|nr:lipoxygenase [Deltaproteobacteria bacterium]
MAQTLSLPQKDAHLSHRTEQLLARQAEYRLVVRRGLPVGEAFHPRDKPGPSWALKLLVACYKNRANTEEYLKICGRKFTNDIPNKAPKELAKMLLSKDFSEILGYYIPRMGLVTSGSPRPNGLDDYRKVFQKEPLPKIAEHFLEDWVFARGFVAGPNPMVLRRLDAPMAKLRITNEVFARGPDFSNDSLTTAISDGRVYIADYAIAAGLQNGVHPQQPKFLTAPIVMLAVPRGGRSLVPIAIQTGQAAEAPIVTPFDGWTWQMAKHAVHAVDGTYQEVVSHLGLTHLILEPFVVATRRHLAEQHPLYALLSPHFEGTMPINALAFGRLINEGQDVDTLVGCTMPSAYKLLGESRLNFSFSDGYAPLDIASRGLDDVSRLPDHPYRDDALLVWQAIRGWVNDYIEHFYKTDDDIVRDHELGNWTAELADPASGAIKNLGQGGRIRTRETLKDVVTMVIFTASAQHAAVNFAQKTDMAFHPGYPLASYKLIPDSKEASEQDYLDILAPIDVAFRSQQSLIFLGSLRYGRLGHYGKKYFADPALKGLMLKFQAKLGEIESSISARNAQMALPYIHLLPSQVPQSTNI